MGESIDFQERVKNTPNFCGEDNCPVLEIGELRERQLALSALRSAPRPCDEPLERRMRMNIIEGETTIKGNLTGILVCPVVERERQIRERRRQTSPSVKDILN